MPAGLGIQRHSGYHSPFGRFANGWTESKWVPGKLAAHSHGGVAQQVRASGS